VPSAPADDGCAESSAEESWEDDTAGFSFSLLPAHKNPFNWMRGRGRRGWGGKREEGEREERNGNISPSYPASHADVSCPQGTNCSYFAKTIMMEHFFSAGQGDLL
jgi:hypothetical protein